MGVLLFKGGVGVGMLKWQTSVVPLAKRGEPKGGGNYELWARSWYKSGLRPCWRRRCNYNTFSGECQQV
jgi:hypothetical protein